MEKAVVLFVDDEEDFRFISIRQIKRILKDLEFEFFEATDGEDALALLKGGLKPSLIMVDYAMPRLNGMELLRRIDRDHKDLYHIPRIMLSGYNSEEIIGEAQKLRYAFFEKTIDNKNFFQQICNYIATRLG